MRNVENEELVVQFFKAMGTTFSEMRVAFEAYLADDCVWQNSGSPTLRGKKEIMRALEAFHDSIGLEDVGGEFLAIASVGDKVLTERHERWTGKDGAVLLASLPLMGTFEVRGGRIYAWRDYFAPPTINATFARP